MKLGRARELCRQVKTVFGLVLMENLKGIFKPKIYDSMS